VRKKRRQIQDAFPDDLFGDAVQSAVEDVPMPIASTSSAPVDVNTLTKEERKANRHIEKLSNRVTRFNDLYSFVTLHIGRRPAMKDAQVRNSAWSQLFELAASQEQLEKVVELMPKWQDGRREFNRNNSELFVSE
jgi:hypothetical protein